MSLTIIIIRTFKTCKVNIFLSQRASSAKMIPFVHTKRMAEIEDSFKTIDITHSRT